MTQKHTIRFVLLFIFAVILRQTPVISIPFNWLESFFHELSHGLAAIATGGKIIQIQLFANGAGLCTTQGGWRFLVSFFGYSGAIIWGALLYLLGGWKRTIATIVVNIVLILLALTLLLWVRDGLTAIIVASLILFFLSLFKYRHSKILQIGLQLAGLTVLLNALMSPLYLIDGQSMGDGATLAKITWIPEIIWVIVWFLLALFCLVQLFRKGYYHENY
jgi:hypothetical protein